MDTSDNLIEELLEVVDSNRIPNKAEAFLMNSEITSRFSGAEWFKEIQKHTVLLAGVGGIGSFVAFLLSRISMMKIYLIDPDIVELSNLSGQLYSTQHIGQSKVSAMKTVMEHYSNYYRINTSISRYRNEYNPIMICGFDNMESRQQFYTGWHSCLPTSLEDRKKCLFIDGRLSADELQIFCIAGDDEYNQKKYAEEHLFKSEEAVPTVCSFKQTSFMSNMIGSLIVNLVVNHIANLLDPVIKKDLPFYTKYMSDFMYFNTVR